MKRKLKRFGVVYADKDAGRAALHDDIEAALQDLQGEEIEMTTPATANTEFTVVHKLRDRVPRSVQVLRTDKGGVIYASRRVDWNMEKVFLKSTVAADTVLIKVR
jgi:hypothetical protein